MSKRRFNWPPFTITVTNDGESVPPWRDKDTDRYAGVGCPRYKVSVSAGQFGRYHCKAWGSVNDAREGHADKHQDMAAMVVDELASAYCDPDEFWETATHDAGRISRERFRELDHLLDAAAKFGDLLLNVAEELREKELV